MPIEDRRFHERRQRNTFATEGPPRRNIVAIAVTEPTLEAADVLSVLRAAVDRAFTTRKQAAEQLGVRTDRLSKWLSGTERFPVAALVRHQTLFTTFVQLALARHGYVLHRTDRWDRLKLVTVRCLRVLCVRVERELKRDSARGA